MSERDLAEAIYAEMCSKTTAAAALDLWQHRYLGHSDRWDMGRVLSTVSRHAIDRVLARRQNEAARTGPWEGPQQPEPIKDVGPGFAAFLRHEMMCCEASGCRWQWFAERQSEDYVRCRSCGSAYPWRDTYYLRRLFEAGEPTSKEDGYPDSLLPPKRGAP